MANIVIVEDDAEMARLMRGVLSPDGHAIRTCDNGLVALEVLAEPADLLLLDVNIPGCDGIEVCRSVRQRERQGHRTTIVMITGRDDTASKLLAFSVGADDYLVKPLDVRELRSRVARWVDARAEQEGLVMRRRREAIQEIVTAICHQVNNPLTSALLSLDLVLEGTTLSTADRDDLGIAREQLVRIAEFVAALEGVEDRTVPYLGNHRMIDVTGKKKD